MSKISASPSKESGASVPMRVTTTTTNPAVTADVMLAGSRVGSRWIFSDQQLAARVWSCQHDVRGVRRLRSTDAERRPA